MTEESSAQEAERHHAAVPLSLDSVRKFMDALDPAAKDRLRHGEWELETPALCVTPGNALAQSMPSTTSLFVGSANGVFTTWCGPTGQQVFVKPVRHTVPRTWPGGCVYGTMDVVGVQLVDREGTELVAQFRPA